MGSRRRKTTTTRRREKRAESREKREERREKREERREKRADGPEEAARGPEMKPPEGDRPFSYTVPPAKARWIDGSNRFILRVDRDCVDRIHRAYAVAMALPSPRPQAGWQKAGRREKREESKWPPARFIAYLRCPVTTSKKF